jgi:hypothetical protein
MSVAEHELTTEQGCRVKVKRIGDGCGFDVVQPSGEKRSFACSVEDARSFAALIVAALGEREVPHG